MSIYFVNILSVCPSTKGFATYGCFHPGLQSKSNCTYHVCAETGKKTNNFDPN